MNKWEVLFLVFGAVNICGILIRLFIDVRELKKERAFLDSLGDQLVVQNVK